MKKILRGPAGLELHIRDCRFVPQALILPRISSNILTDRLPKKKKKKKIVSKSGISGEGGNNLNFLKYRK